MPILIDCQAAIGFLNIFLQFGDFCNAFSSILTKVLRTNGRTHMDSLYRYEGASPRVSYVFSVLPRMKETKIPSPSSPPTMWNPKDPRASFPRTTWRASRGKRSSTAAMVFGAEENPPPGIPPALEELVEKWESIEDPPPAWMRKYKRAAYMNKWARNDEKDRIREERSISRSYISRESGRLRKIPRFRLHRQILERLFRFFIGKMKR